MVFNKCLKTAAVLIIGAFVFITACADLSVENLNDPDRDLALNEPGDIRALVEGGYNTWAFMGSWRTLLPHAVQADWATGTVGNWWVNNGGHVPREEFPNSPTGPYPDVNQDFWEDYNGSLANANLAVIAIDGGTLIGSEANTLGIKAAAQFLQALNFGALGLLFDQAFIIDENTDLDDFDNIELQPYEDVIQAAIEKIEAAKATAAQAVSAGSSSFPEDFIPPLGTIDSRWAAVGSTLGWDDFEKIANSYAATFLALSPRSVQENDQADWAQIYQYANAGIDFDFAPITDADTNWQSQLIKYINQDWVRPNLHVINMLDPNIPVHWPSSGVAPEPNSPDARYNSDPDAGADFSYNPGWSIFNPDRGIFKRSHVLYRRYAYHNFSVATTGPIPHLLRAQNDLILAEAELRRSGGDRANAAELINRYRVGRGELSAVSAASSDEELHDAIYYEWIIEVGPSGLLATPLFTNRRTGNLTSGTMVHWPIPASELGVLELPYYSFGGGGEGSAPKMISRSTQLQPIR